MEIKEAQCQICNTPVTISKFASPKLAKCDDCKALGLSTGNRTRPTQPVKGTKDWAMDKLSDMFDILDIINDIIKQNVDAGIIKSGWLMAHGINFDYSYNWFHGFDGEQCKMYGAGKKKTKVSDYQYHTKRVREKIIKVGEELLDAGADMEFDQFIVCRYGIKENRLREYIVKCGLIDGNYEEYIDELGEEDAIERGIDNLEQNEIDTWVDHLRANGHDDRQSR